MSQLTAKALESHSAEIGLIGSSDNATRDLGTLLGLDIDQERAELGFARDQLTRKGLSRRDARKRGTRSAHRPV